MAHPGQLAVPSQITESPPLRLPDQGIFAWDRRLGDLGDLGVWVGDHDQKPGPSPPGRATPSSGSAPSCLCAFGPRFRGGRVSCLGSRQEGLDKQNAEIPRPSTNRVCCMHTGFPLLSCTYVHVSRCDEGYLRASSRPSLAVGSSVLWALLGPSATAAWLLDAQFGIHTWTGTRGPDRVLAIALCMEDGSGEGSDVGKARMWQARPGSARHLSDSKCVSDKPRSAPRREFAAPARIRWPKKGNGCCRYHLWHALTAKPERHLCDGVH